MKILSLAAITVMFFLSSPASAEQTDYRVAGVIGQLGARLYAIVEAPDGSNTIYTQGDMLGGMPILAISDRGVIVEKDGERLLLPLREGALMVRSANFVADSSNSDRVAAQAETQATTEADPEREWEPPEVATLNLNYKDIVKKLDGIKEQIAAGRILTAADLNNSLGLPEMARISTVGGVSLATPAGALTMIRDQLARGEISHLLIAGVAGFNEIYLTPAEE